MVLSLCGLTGLHQHFSLISLLRRYQTATIPNKPEEVELLTHSITVMQNVTPVCQGSG